MMTWRHPLPFHVLVWVIASVVTAMIGPFTTYASFAFLERLAYWGLLIGVSILMAYSIRAVVVVFIPTPGWASELVTSAGQSLALGTAIWAFNFYILGFDLGSIRWIIEHITVVFVVCLAILVVRAYVRAHRAEAPDAAAALAGHPHADDREVPTVVEEAAPFLRRLDRDLGEELHSVSANDHYLQVVTAMGEGRVLLRFRDALEELAEVPGYRIHRSHWVASAALISVRQDGRRYFAVLRNGAELPVSRGNVDRLREDGWLD